jgi:hypothetical protein
MQWQQDTATRARRFDEGQISRLVRLPDRRGELSQVTRHAMTENPAAQFLQHGNFPRR